MGVNPQDKCLWTFWSSKGSYPVFLPTMALSLVCSEPKKKQQLLNYILLFLYYLYKWAQKHSILCVVRMSVKVQQIFSIERDIVLNQHQDQPWLITGGGLYITQSQWYEFIFRKACLGYFELPENLPKWNSGLDLLPVWWWFLVFLGLYVTIPSCDVGYVHGNSEISDFALSCITRTKNSVQYTR